MNLKDRLKDFLQYYLWFPDDQIRESIRKSNIQRLLWLAILAIPVNIYHVLTFLPRISSENPSVVSWGEGIIFCHSASIAFFLIIGFIAFTQLRKKVINQKLISLTIMLTFLFIVILGAIIVSVDQLVTDAISPYLILSMIMALVFRVPPLQILPFYILSFVTFFIGIQIFQLDQDILLSNRVNGITIVSLAFLVSVIYWKNTITRFLQNRIIEKQKLELNEKLIQLQQLNDAKDKLFSIIAHDLISPFNVITGMTGLLKDNFDSFEKDEVVNYIGNVNESSQKAYDLLVDLLSWARVQTGAMISKPTVFDINSVINNVISILKQSATTKNLKLRYDNENSVLVFADIDMIKTVIRNLVSNAIKYSFPESEILITASLEDSKYRIAVKDSGVGISEENINAIFSTQSKMSTPGTHDEKGVGLGLTLCRDFLEKQGSKLEILSSPEKGSTFSFLLPLSPL